MSLPYDLALRLKNAGFPQTKVQGAWWYDERKNAFLHPYGYGEMEDAWIPKCTRIPTLSEIIKACGDRELELKKKFSEIDYKYEWRAQVPHQDVYAHGSTPLIAVAHLYLALNEKV